MSLTNNGQNKYNLKSVILFFCCLYCCTAISQKINTGYIVNSEHDTLIGKLNITVNAHVKFSQGKQVTKYKKLNLLDYGEVDGSKYNSFYHKTAFPHITKKGILYSNTGDSIAVYIYKQSAKRINYYNQQKEKEKASISDIDVYKIIGEDGKTYTYERLAVPQSYQATIGVKNKDNDKKDLFFGKKIASGTVDLYKTYSSTTSFSSNLHSTPTMNSEYTEVYLLKKGDRVEIIPKNKLSLKSKDLLKSFIKDQPELSEKIGAKGYRIKNIQKIIQEYNRQNTKT